ncbi:MAG: sigma-54 dependent transcriptional regulator [Myxococcaceae bacterium]
MKSTPIAWVKWLASLAEAAGRAHTDSSLATAVLESSPEMRQVEIGRADSAGNVTAAVRATARGTHPLTPNPSRGVAAETLTRGSHVRVRGEPMLALRLADAGYALITVRDAHDCPVEILQAAGAILVGALRHIEVVGRLAALSRQAHQEGHRLREELSAAVLPEGVVAASRSSRQLYLELLPQLARHDGAVLIRGESGTGKEVVARQLHALSPRSSRPFVTVNCGAIPENLLESTLFGHERGAFTGADARQIGLFERANGGTLFLDEVAELTPAAQVKLLRVLQEKELERLGGSSSIGVDVRVIAATHQPLEKLIASRRFRSDLYYRLAVLPVSIAPLRERPEDLELLAHQIVDRASARLGRAVPRLDAITLEQLKQRAWPGNVRELQNVLERATLLSRGASLELSAEPLPIAAPVKAARVEPLNAAIRRSIEAALRDAHGRVYGPHGAAKRLGLKPTTLQSKMKKLGIGRSTAR